MTGHIDVVDVAFASCGDELNVEMGGLEIGDTDALLGVATRWTPTSTPMATAPVAVP
jgi:hypothetical protein